MLHADVGLAWSHLAGLQPDAIVVVGGGTDVTNPWTFDPRPGHPTNAFAVEEVYDYLFGTGRIASRELDLSYDDLTGRLYERSENLRLDHRWRTAEWETAVVDATGHAMRGFSSPATALRVLVLCVLQPTIVCKKNLSPDEQNLGSDDYFAYLDRQYRHLEDRCVSITALELPNELYEIHDLSGKFANEAGQIFYDAAHYVARDRQMMAEDLAEKLTLVLRRRRWRSEFRRLRELVLPR